MIKNLVVNLSTGKDEDGARDYAISLARELDAHLAAVAFAYEPIPAATLIGDASGEWLDELRQDAEEAANAAIERFNAAVRGSGILAEARALTTTMTGAAPALRGLPYQVIVDGRNARGRFGRHPNCFPLSVRTGDPPKVHDAAVDCDVEQQSMRPGLVVQMREDAVPNGRVGKLDIQILVAAGQGLQEIGTADDAEKRAISDDRHPLDGVPFKQSSDFVQRGIRRRRDHVARHHVGNRASMRLGVLGGERIVSGKHAQPPGVPPLGPDLRPVHQVAFADDAHQLAFVVHHGNSADPAFQERLHDPLMVQDCFTEITGDTITSRAFIANLPRRQSLSPDRKAECGPRTH